MESDILDRTITWSQQSMLLFYIVNEFEVNLGFVGYKDLILVALSSCSVSLLLYFEGVSHLSRLLTPHTSLLV